jgi:hypothetical protein
MKKWVVTCGFQDEEVLIDADRVSIENCCLCFYGKDFSQELVAAFSPDQWSSFKLKGD